jgi:hypothetical protein
LVCNNICFFEFDLHCIDFRSQLSIFIMHVSYQTDLNIMESTFFLKFMPFLLKNIKCLVHFEFLHEVSNKIINNNISA